MQTRVCQAEMLDFLSRMKSRSVQGIALNSIDEHNLPDISESYLYALQEEISRVLVREGIVFGTGDSAVIDFILKNNFHFKHAFSSPVEISGVIEHAGWKIVQIEGPGSCSSFSPRHLGQLVDY
jgi:hypothetical protein